MKTYRLAVLGQCRHQSVDNRVNRALRRRHALLQFANPLVSHQPAKQIFLKDSHRPLAEFYATLGIDSKANGNNSIQIIMLYTSGDSAATLKSNY